MPQDFGSGDAEEDCATCPPKTENVVVIGSEFEYELAGFQLKLMFMACGWATAAGQRVPPGWTAADRTTVAYVREGYNRHELLNLDWLRDTLGVRIVRIGSVGDFLGVLRDRGEGEDRHVIRNLALYCHGLPDYLSLNYDAWTNQMNVRLPLMLSLPTDLFSADGTIHSYACRTAMRGYGQGLANHFGVRVKAFKRRTNYGSVIRDRGRHAEIAEQMSEARQGREGQVVSLPPAHEAYPHPGLSAGSIPFFDDGGETEGINDYALWRLNGARALPVSGSSPEDQPAGMFTLRPADE